MRAPLVDFLCAETFPKSKSTEVTGILFDYRVPKGCTLYLKNRDKSDRSAKNGRRIPIKSLQVRAMITNGGGDWKNQITAGQTPYMAIPIRRDLLPLVVVSSMFDL